MAELCSRDLKIVALMSESAHPVMLAPRLMVDHVLVEAEV